MKQPYFSAAGIELYCGDCLEIIPDLPEVNAIIADFPYNGVLDNDWDNAWRNNAEFIEWIGKHASAFQDVLRFNGSLFAFAYPSLAAYVEVEISKYFNVLNHIVWNKRNGGTSSRTDKSALRSFLPLSERIIFAEHYGSDNAAKGESGYARECDQLRGFVFEPLREYLDTEKERAGFTTRKVAEAFQKKTGSRTVTGMAGHWFSSVQWTLPTQENYTWLQNLLNKSGGDFLRREYEDLRREYEDLRRPFSVSADVQYSDVWEFNTSSGEGSHHPAQKPIALMLHIVLSSTRPNDLILDPFAGSGTTAIAAIRTGRRCIVIEQDEGYCEIAARRIEKELQQPRLFVPDVVQELEQQKLFKEA